MKKYQMIGTTIGFGVALVIVFLMGLDGFWRASSFAFGAGIGCYAGQWFGNQNYSRSD